MKNSSRSFESDLSYCFIQLCKTLFWRRQLSCDVKYKWTRCEQGKGEKISSTAKIAEVWWLAVEMMIFISWVTFSRALGESYPVERNRFPWHPRTVPPLLVGGSHCVLRSGANAYRCLVKRIVIPGPVVSSFPEFLEHFVGKCRQVKI
jgi:hypothetical protein